jgi:hypothetical protein
MARLTRDELVAFVAASCARSGVPVRITDPVAVARVAVLLAGRDAGPTAQRRAADRPASDPPNEIDPARIESSTTAFGGGDHGMIEDGPHDRMLSGQVQIGPLCAEGDTVADDAA